MTEDELRELEAKKLAAEVAKEEAETKKLNLEATKLDSELKKPFYSSKEFLRPLAAGISLALLLAAYIQYVFLPAQVRLTQKAETAEFTLQQNLARHSAQMARLELVKTRIEEDAKVAKFQLEQAELRLKEANDQNTLLQERIQKLSEKDKSDNELQQLQSDVKASSNKISSQLAKIEDQRLQIQELGEAAEEKGMIPEGAEGWIYVGYFPGDVWKYRTIKIDKGEPVVGQLYEVTRNVNLRTQYPKLTLFGYKYGDTSGFLVPGQKVAVKDIKEVGRSKVWAYVRVSSHNNGP